MGVLILATLPVLQPTTPLAAPSGPEACALCSEFPQYCNACYLFIWVVSTDPENWEVYYE
jgi:hypothetical protein